MSENLSGEKTPTPTKSADSYLFLGLPKSGKTTYFTVMAKTLQEIAAKGDSMKFRCENDATREFVEAWWDTISAPEPDWPEKTVTYDGGYEFSLLQRISLLGFMLPWGFGCRKASVCYHDYPGEAFQAAFGDVDNDAYKAQADQMRRQISQARGVFLLLDADKLFNGADRKMLAKTTHKLFEFITKNNEKVKLAILFNKLELFEGTEKNRNLEDEFRRLYDTACNWLPRNARFFNVYPIGKLDLNDGCRKVPARKIAPRGVLAPVQWMIGFKGSF